MTIDFERVRFCLEVSREFGTRDGRYDEIRLIWLNEAAKELRFNPYHDPENGRFTSGNKFGVDFSRDSGIIGNIKNGSADNDVHYIGKIDKEIYKCVSNDILTDEVIITETHIAHIKERHPNDFERYFQYANEILRNPDYILEANKPDTAFVLKHIVENGKNYQLVLRLKTSSDPQSYSNSVITFLKIDDRKWAKYLRNKKILYDKSKTVDKKE